MTASNNNTLGRIIALISANRWFVVITTVVIAAAVIAGNLLLSDFEYRADTQLLVVQYTDTASVDGEKTQRSTENISRNLAQVMNTSSFIDATLASGKVPAGIIEGSDELSKKESWSNKVVASSVPNSPRIKISAYDSNPQEAIVLAQAAADTMIAKAPEYHGAAKFAIEVKSIDQATVTPKPVRPNIAFAAVVGLFGGFIVSILYLLMVKEWRLMSMFMHYWRKPRQEYEPTLQPVQPPVPVYTEPAIEVDPVQVPSVYEESNDAEQSLPAMPQHESEYVPQEEYQQIAIEPASYQVLDHQNFREELNGKHLDLAFNAGKVVSFHDALRVA